MGKSSSKAAASNQLQKENTGKLLFHPRCGTQAAVTQGQRSAQRLNATDDYDNGVILTNRTLQPGEIFEVQMEKLVTKWTGSLEIGVTTHSPRELQFPSTMTDIRSGTWMMTGNQVVHNGEKVLSQYGNNLDKLKVGDRVGVLRKANGTLHFFLNGVDQGPAARNVPVDVYGVIDLYGRAAQATIIDQADAAKLKVGDVVRIMNDEDIVRQLQDGHGGWKGHMRSSLGKVGKVISVVDAEDVKVQIEGNAWVFNCVCCERVNRSLLPGGTADESSSDDDNDADSDDLMALLFLKMLQDATQTSNRTTHVALEAASGNMGSVRRILNDNPGQVNVPFQGIPALHRACHGGHEDMVKLLISFGARINELDSNNITALHVCVACDKPRIAEILLSHRADVNALGPDRKTPLHLAVAKASTTSSAVILKHKANVNIQDSDGDTPLFDTIHLGNNDLVQLLIEAPGTDFNLRNKKGFNVLHLASGKGNALAIGRILSKAPRLIDVQKDDGFTALHLAVLNRNFDAAKMLLIQGKAKVDIRNILSRTPLYLAVEHYEGKDDIKYLDLLISHGADLDAQDNDGDTCLHLAVIKHSRAAIVVAALTDASVVTRVNDKSASTLAEYLVARGADVNKQNFKGKTPLDMALNERLVERLTAASTTNFPTIVNT